MSGQQTNISMNIPQPAVMKTVKIVLGEKEYTLRPLPLRKSGEMRRALKAEVDQIAGIVESAQGASLDNPKAIGDLLRVASALVADLTERLFDLICRFSPEIAADREELLDTAYDEQVMDAFMEVLGLLFPFGKMAGTLNGLMDSMT